MKKRPYDLSAAARLDLLHIWNYLAETVSLDVADKVLADVESAIGVIGSAPELGHPRPDLTDREVLFYGIHSYLIVYRPRIKPIHVLRVFHAARDVKALMDDDRQ